MRSQNRCFEGYHIFIINDYHNIAPLESPMFRVVRPRFNQIRSNAGATPAPEPETAYVYPHNPPLFECLC